MWKAYAAVLLLACSAAEHPADAEPKPGSCDATAKTMGKATKLAAWKPPADCTPKPVGNVKAIGTEADALPQFECKGTTTKLGIDFKQRQLVVTTRSFSPAQVGLDVYDDGKQITFVSRQRIPCKDDPRPMPGPDTTFLFTPASGARTFAEGSCSVATKCP
jgi:hypothetical protein